MAWETPSLRTEFATKLPGVSGSLRPPSLRTEFATSLPGVSGGFQTGGVDWAVVEEQLRSQFSAWLTSRVRLQWPGYEHRDVDTDALLDLAVADAVRFLKMLFARRPDVEKSFIWFSDGLAEYDPNTEHPYIMFLNSLFFVDAQIEPDRMGPVTAFEYEDATAAASDAAPPARGPIGHLRSARCPLGPLRFARGPSISDREGIGWISLRLAFGIFDSGLAFGSECTLLIRTARELMVLADLGYLGSNEVTVYCPDSATWLGDLVRWVYVGGARQPLKFRLAMSMTERDVDDMLNLAPYCTKLRVCTRRLITYMYLVREQTVREQMVQEENSGPKPNEVTNSVPKASPSYSTHCPLLHIKITGSPLPAFVFSMAAELILIRQPLSLDLTCGNAKQLKAITTNLARSTVCGRTAKLYICRVVQRRGVSLFLPPLMNLQRAQLRLVSGRYSYIPAEVTRHPGNDFTWWLAELAPHCTLIANNFDSIVRREDDKTVTFPSSLSLVENVHQHRRAWAKECSARVAEVLDEVTPLPMHFHSLWSRITGYAGWCFSPLRYEEIETER